MVDPDIWQNRGYGGVIWVNFFEWLVEALEDKRNIDFIRKNGF